MSFLIFRHRDRTGPNPVLFISGESRQELWILCVEFCTIFIFFEKMFIFFRKYLYFLENIYIF